MSKNKQTFSCESSDEFEVLDLLDMYVLQAARVMSRVKEAVKLFI